MKMCRFWVVTAAFSIAFLLFQTGCITKTNLDGYPEISFLNDIQPILTGNCNQQGCHGLVNPGEFTLNSYEDVMHYVKAGDARGSTLYLSVTGRTEEFMPPAPANRLSDTQLSKIFIWIEQGAKNN